MTEQQVKQCRECQANSDRQVYEPLKPSKMPERPWQSVSADFFGPTPGGWYWFVNICDHSNWASVEKIRATSEEQVEPVLDRLFETFVALEVYKTDNGSPFQSHHLLLGFSRSSGIPSITARNARATGCLAQDRTSQRRPRQEANGSRLQRAHAST